MEETKNKTADGTTLTVNLKPDSVIRLRKAGLTAERLEALYLIGEMDLLRDVKGLSPNEIYKIRSALSPNRPVYHGFRWVYKLALTVLVGDEYGLDTLLYVEPNQTLPIIDRVVAADRSTEKAAYDLLRMVLTQNEFDVIKSVFRYGSSLQTIAKSWHVGEDYICQIYQRALDKINDETAISDRIIELVFRTANTE